MSFFNRLFGKRDTRHASAKESIKPEELIELHDFVKTLSDLLNQDKFISRKESSQIIEQGIPLYRFFDSLEKGNSLDTFCQDDSSEIATVNSLLHLFRSLPEKDSSSPSFVKKHNEDYIARHLVSDKQYLDTILCKADPGIMLDEEQRRVVLSDEDYTLVVAGAGAGKTTTIAAKVKYLVEKKGIEPKKILIVSFTNKAVEELKSRISSLGINCPVSTFHSAGYAILRKKEDEKLQIVDSGFLFSSVDKYLKETVLTQPDLVKKIILFFGSYFDAPFDEGKDLEQYFQRLLHMDTSTLKGNMPGYETCTYDRVSGKKITLNNEMVRSYEEVRIANFLYLNQIDYIYEDPYQYHILRAHKPYTPDFHIFQNGRDAYIEHFGITESGTNSRYSPEQLYYYKRSIEDKIKLHKRHGTNLITSYSKYNDGKDLLTHLKEKLIRNGFVLSPRPYDAIYKQLASNEESKYIAKLVRLIVNFIVLFKTNGFDEAQFDILRGKSNNVRNKLFLDIAKCCYLDYQKNLRGRNAVDFEDMINLSTKMIEESERIKGKIDFDYIIVDEYQDISRQRFNLTKELSKMCNAKIMAVGDDWQSIYGYAGSDISLFTKFKDSMENKYADELIISRTYRNSQEVINIAGNFIQKNKMQIKKQLISSKTITDPVIIEAYSERVDPKRTKGKGGKYYGIGKAVENCIERILSESPRSSNKKILIIGRYGFDARNLCFSEDFSYDPEQGIVHSKRFRSAKLFYLTAHKSKGLGFDNVILVNARDDIYGFPAKIDNDPVLDLVNKEDCSIEYAEERRLFYVAMTRTKNRVYIVTPKEHPSEFVRELVNDYKDNIVLNGELESESESSQNLMKRCPLCGYPLQLRQNKNIGLRLWMCTNEPEICDFITNDLNGGELQIRKCEMCRDGYLIVKRGTTYFLGCSNYRKDGSGCKNSMSLEDFHAEMARDDEEFSTDLSTNKPSFLVQESDSAYKERIEREAKTKETRKATAKTADVHKTHKEERFVGKERFDVIVDENGELLTDWDLLLKLKERRDLIAFRDHIPIFAVAKSNWLVLLATYKPKNAEECSSIRGLLPSFYLKYGKELIELIAQ